MWRVTAILVLCSSAAAQPAKPRELASLERSPCEGDCPAYKLTVYRDGRVEWNGSIAVKRRGKATGQLPPKALRELERAFADARYFELPTRFDCADDTPVARTTFDDGTRRRTIAHDSACDRSGRTSTLRTHAATLTRLESEIDRITNSVQWVGTEAERKAIRAGKP